MPLVSQVKAWAEKETCHGRSLGRQDLLMQFVEVLRLVVQGGGRQEGTLSPEEREA